MDQENKATNNQISLYLIVEYTPQRFVSASVFDDRRRTFEITSFSDNEHYTNLESLLIQTNPHEPGDTYTVFVNIKTDIESEKAKILAKL